MPGLGLRLHPKTGRDQSLQGNDTGALGKRNGQRRGDDGMFKLRVQGDQETVLVSGRNQRESLSVLRRGDGKEKHGIYLTKNAESAELSNEKERASDEID